MGFQGKVLSVSALLDANRAAPPYGSNHRFGVLHTAAGAALDCRNLLAEGETLDGCWRFGVLQILDDYASTLRRGGVELAAGVFTEEPSRTGAPQLDAAFAALADYLSGRDGWVAPEWVFDPARSTPDWYPAVPMILRGEADIESPPEFRSRGILITSRSLERA